MKGDGNWLGVERRNGVEGVDWDLGNNSGV